MALVSWWWPLSPWLSPAAAWFILFNAVVGAIAVMSTSAAPTTTPSSRRRLCRSGSSMVLDRLRTFFVFPGGQLLPIEETSAAAASASHLCSSREAEAAVISNAQPSPCITTATAEDHVPPVPPAAAAAAEEEAAETEAEPEKEEQDHDDESISLDEAYARAQRQRAKPLASPPSPAAAAAADSATAAPAKVVAEWRRVSRAGPGEAAVVEGKAELNARAELFIRRFREDLRLQRLNSILTHTHHALGSPTPTAAAR